MQSRGGGLEQDQERCMEANTRLYAPTQATKNAQELEAAYAHHTAPRNAVLQAYTYAHRRILN
jgi:hypothetical protein